MIYTVAYKKSKNSFWLRHLEKDWIQVVLVPQSGKAEVRELLDYIKRTEPIAEFKINAEGSYLLGESLTVDRIELSLEDKKKLEAKQKFDLFIESARTNLEIFPN